MRFTMRPHYYLLLCVPSLIVHGQFQRNWIPTDKWIHHEENLRSLRGHKEEINGESRKYSIEGADGFKDFLFVIDKLKTHRSKAFVQRRLCCQCLLWKLALDLGHFLSLISLLPSSANTAGRSRLEFQAKNHVIAALFRWEKYTTELSDWATSHGMRCYRL